MQNTLNIESTYPSADISILTITKDGCRWPVVNSSQRIALFIGIPPDFGTLQPLIDVNNDVIVVLKVHQPTEESEGDDLYDAVVRACHLFCPHAIYTNHGVGTLIALHRPTKEVAACHIPILAQWCSKDGEHILYGSVATFAVPPIETDPQI